MRTSCARGAPPAGRRVRPRHRARVGPGRFRRFPGGGALAPVRRTAGISPRDRAWAPRPARVRESGTNPCACAPGRIHAYEGHDAATVAFPARALGALGARALVVTNAAGACNPWFAPGDLMRITDHINFTGRNPLTGVNEDRLGPRFPDLTHAYAARLAGALEEAARSVGQSLRAGVYIQMNGPSYETPAEIRMARSLGADAVGM